jgi:all-trans-retinol dehydrogenase (NAD+)
MSQSLLRPNSLLAVSAPLLFLLTASPLSLRNRLLTHLPARVDRAKLITVLIYLAAAGTVGQLSKWLSAWARNNWVLSAWGNGRSRPLGMPGWGEEVAVVTGGAQGIGALTVKGLAAKGIKVAILDITEPAEEGW